MTTTTIIIICLFMTALIVWFIESRVFLYLWYKLIFPHTKNPPLLHEDKVSYFPESAIFENNWEQIKEELMNYHLKHYIPKFHEIDSRQKRISFDKGPAWRTILLKAHGAWFDKNCSAFPLTQNLIKQCKNVSTALFSILEPGVQIPPHTGKFNGVLRYHLALQVPSKGHCFLRVGGKVYHWTEGKGVLFDDTYLHEVKNLSDEYRIVLFMDIKRNLPVLLRLPDYICHCLAIFSPKYIYAKKAGTMKLDL